MIITVTKTVQDGAKTFSGSASVSFNDVGTFYEGDNAEKNLLKDRLKTVSDSIVMDQETPAQDPTEADAKEFAKTIKEPTPTAEVYERAAIFYRTTKERVEKPPFRSTRVFRFLKQTRKGVWLFPVE